ncbi:Poly polymerase [Eumeta japonica]|uniref:Poly [ADP-ribose] polymerase n=1 Tax=Eumeta variegata TaxID=151549 RepID=A0A4C1V1Z2_EUMVA|nr:Poly polymerase [Eumeta japonica]
MSELPYQAEYAKSGRASCKKCKQKIDQGALRLAVMVQSAFFDGKQPNWYHEECFFSKQRPKSVDDIGKFNTLTHSDQKRLTSVIGDLSSGVVMPIENKSKGKGTKRGNSDNNAALKDFAIEYSKSSRATCKVCDIKICKDEVRICKIVYDTEVGQKFGGQPLWHHVNCFAEARSELLYMAGGENLPGYKSLKKEDQKMVKDAIKPLKLDEIPVKKLKEEPKDEKELKQEKEFDKKIEKQNNLFQKYRKALSECTKNDLDEILETNLQEVPSGRDEKINHLADCMAFGALEPCPKCNQGQFILENYGYKCTVTGDARRTRLPRYPRPARKRQKGIVARLPVHAQSTTERAIFRGLGNISEWTKCQNIVQNPKRVPMKIPKEFKDYSVFSKYKPKVGVRLFTSPQPPKQIIVKKEEPSEGSQKSKPIPPLKNLQFFIYGKVSNKEEIKKKILKLGGLVPSKLNDSIAAVVSTKADVEKMSDKMISIQEQQIEVVEQSFFDLINKEKGSVSDSLQLIKENNIAEWGSDPKTRVPQDVIDGKSMPKSGSIYTKSSKSGVQKLKLKGGTAVDPDSELQDISHVYKDPDGTKWTVVLNKTDVIAQKNSYYKLQLLESDNSKKYWLFKSWGRTGTTIGGNKVQSCKSLSEAQTLFESAYMDKTQNPWEDRLNFVKVPDGYYPVDMDYGDDQVASKVLEVDKNSKLPVPVQQLICKIFDVQLMKKTLLEFELDAEKMPLGKLSKKQIMSGYKVLSELLILIEKGKADEIKVIDATNRFYTFIPHDFGIQNPPLLNNVDFIKKKTEMLDNLLEIEIAYNMLNQDSSDNTLSPVDGHYLKLKAEIIPLDEKSPEYEMILTYVKNTHAETHTFYTLEIKQIFKVMRENEDKRYKPFKKLHNRRLLWHGSRTTNFTGIISQGLRIAPPEAPVTGYMFGKGIYFADMVSKSANYCCTSQSEPMGLMLLCEVALGNILKREYRAPCAAATRQRVAASSHLPTNDTRCSSNTAVAIAALLVDSQVIYYQGCGWESLMKNVTLGNVTMSHRTRERPAECLASLSHSTMIGLPRAQH